MTHRTRSPRSSPRLVLAALLLGALTVLPAGPAQAHDRLTSSDPESGATLSEAPEDIELTFSATVQDVGGSVDLVDGDGDAVDVGSMSADGSTVTTSVDEELPAGDYEVRWRVVSSDGHPISGVVTFSVEEGGEAAGDSSGSDESSPETTEFSRADGTSSASADSPSATADEEEADSGESPEEESDSSAALPLLGAAAVVVVLGAGAALVFSRRRGRH